MGRGGLLGWGGVTSVARPRRKMGLLVLRRDQDEEDQDMAAGGRRADGTGSRNGWDAPVGGNDSLRCLRW